MAQSKGSDPFTAFAETSMEQARKAFEDYVVTAQKAFTGFAAPSAGNVAEGMQESARSLGADALNFAEENMAANFEFARKLMTARTFEDVAKVQSDFIEKQMASYARQGEKLRESLAKAAAKGGMKAGGF